MIKGKLVVIDNLNLFKTMQQSSDPIPDSAVVFIKNEGQIWTKGSYFGVQKTYTTVSKTDAGLAPKGGDSASSLISNVDTEWVLTVTSGASPSWRKLPANAFKNTTYTFYNLAFKNSEGTTVDTYKPTTSPTKTIKAGSNVTISASDNVITIAATDTTYSVMGGASADNNGTSGLVPQPTKGNQAKFLRADGSWATPTNTTYSVVTAAKNGLVPRFDAADGTIDAQDSDWVLTNNNGSIGWYKLPANAFNNSTYSVMSGATPSDDGTQGLVPKPTKSDVDMFLKGDGTWATPTNTTYSIVTKTANGLVPKTGTSASATISSEANEWVLTTTSGNTPTWRKLPSAAFTTASYTLPTATTSALGGIKVGSVNTDAFANLSGKFYSVNVDKNGLAYVQVPWTDTTYTLPTATSSKLGGVKVGTTLTDVTGYTAVHIKDGVIYYKDTNSTNYLPLSGGTVTKTSSGPAIIIKNTTSTTTASYIQCECNSGNAIMAALPYEGAFIGEQNTTSRIGVSWTGVPIYIQKDTGVESSTIKHTLWHSGNFTPADYLPLSGGTMNDEVSIKFQGNNTYGSSRWAIFAYGPSFQIKYGNYGGTTTPNGAFELSNDGKIYNAGKLVLTEANISSYNAGSASLIKPSLGTYAASIWNPQASFTSIWAEKFGYSSLGEDTGDLVFYLRQSQYVNNGVELCLAIDGDYYANSGQSKVIHTGNISSYIPTSLPANGGNADTVDGYHASSFALSSHTHSYLSTNIASGLTSTATVNYANTPYGVNYRNHYSGHGLGSYRGVLSCKDNAVGFELNSYWCVNPTDGVRANNLYYRVKRDSASDWGPYARIIDSGNIGLQSVNYATTAGAIINLTKTTQAVWGTLTSANGYKNLVTWDESDGSGGSWSIQSKGGKISMQIDGDYYANEGNYKVIHEGNIGNYVTGGTSSNADTVDGYHASSLWRSDGGTWNPQANIALNATANSQEWSFDITRNGYTGCYWHVWDSSLGSCLKVDADSGKVTACYAFNCASLQIGGQSLTFVT